MSGAPEIRGALCACAAALLFAGCSGDAAGPSDAGANDAGANDAGQSDAGAADAGALNATVTCPTPGTHPCAGACCAWTITPMLSQAMNFTLAVSDAGAPAIAYYDSVAGQIAVTRSVALLGDAGSSGAVIVSAVIDASDLSFYSRWGGERAVVGLDGAGRPRVAFRHVDAQADYIDLARWSGGDFFTADAGGSFALLSVDQRMPKPGGYGSGLALTSDGSGSDYVVHEVSQSDQPVDSVRVTRFGAGAPSDTIVETQAGCGETGCGVLLDGAGAIHAGLSDIAIEELSPDAGVYARTILGYANNRGGYAMVADRAGVEHIAWSGESRADYLAFVPEQLWYRRAGVAERIDLMTDGPDGGAPTGRVSLAVDDDGVARVAYAVRGVVKYGVRSGGVWNVSVIDSGPSCGEWVSLALDASGRAHVVYRDGASQTLKYARSAAVAK